MSERTEVLAQRAALERQRLSQVFDSLEDEMSELTDWRTYIKREPALALGVATVAGVIGGMLLTPRPSRGRSERLGAAIRGAKRSSALRDAARSLLPQAPNDALRKAAPLVIELLIARALASYTRQRKQRRAQAAEPAETV